MPRVSIVMCTYNGERYLARQLDSILQQTYPLHEILIQDDGSTDRTCQIVEEYREKHPLIRLIRNGKNLGFNHNFLDAIPKATGDYIALSDQDDIWALDKIASLIETVQATGKAVCFSRSQAFSEETGPVAFFDRRTPNYTIERLILANIAPGHTLLIDKDFSRLLTRESFEKVGRWYYDEFIAATAAAYDQLAFCDKYLVSYRRHAGQITAAQSTSQIEVKPLRYVIGSVRLYFRKKAVMTAWFAEKNRFLADIPENHPHLENARKLTLLSSRRDLLSFLRLLRLCVRTRRYIYFTAEVRPVVLFFRALFYPIYCANYFRD